MKIDREAVAKRLEAELKALENAKNSSCKSLRNLEDIKRIQRI